jgi:hypothetical protein
LGCRILVALLVVSVSQLGTMGYFPHPAGGEPHHLYTPDGELVAGEGSAVAGGVENTATPRQNLIVAEANSNRLIGQVSRYWISEETDWLAAGIVIYNPTLWSKGYGTEAPGLWTSYLFTAFPRIVRLDLQTWSGNDGMMRVANKLGYQFEWRFRKARIVAGEYYDALGYGVLREEWEQRRLQGLGR